MITLTRRAARRLAGATAILLTTALGAAAHEAGNQHQSHASSAAGTPSTDDAAFLAENEIVMAKMMDGMAKPPSGDVDRDFVEMMIPHHQGAIDMALLMLRYGRNEQLKRLAQEIVVTQRQEIAVMRLAIGDPHPRATPGPVDSSAAHQPSAIGFHQ